MQAAFQRTLRSGREYEALFDTSRLERTDPIAIKSGDTFDTIELMARLARQYQADTAALAPKLRGPSLAATCHRIWQFAYSHFQYTPDKSGVEQLRRPLRAWADRRAGIDCDCYSILISTILLNLGIAHKLRKTKYHGRPDYQHIYVVVPKPGGGYYTLDPVTDAFDKEVPFTEKFDKQMMPIQVLNGLADAPTPPAAPRPAVPVGAYRKFGFGAEFVGLVGETEQVQEQALASLRTAALQGLAAASISDTLPGPAELARLAAVTGQSPEEAAADALAVQHAHDSFIERLRQYLVNTGEQIDQLPAGQRPPVLVTLRGRIKLLLAAWTDAAARARLFDVLGAREAAENLPVAGGVHGLGHAPGLGNIFGDAWNGIKKAGSAVGSAVGGVVGAVGGAIKQAAGWVGDKVATAAKATAEGIKNAAKWVGNEAVGLGKLLIKYNPVSILVRTGLRIAFRVNIFYMAGRLGHGYFTEAQVRAAGFDVTEWQNAKSTLGKVISMWEGLQGDAGDLQSYILVGYESGKQPKIASAPALSGLGRPGGLGEPATIAGTAAASGFIATILNWLKSVDWGKLFGTAATLAQKLNLAQQYAATPNVTDQTPLPTSEADYAANQARYDRGQPAAASSSALPVALAVLAGGALLLKPKLLS